nr:reverse transcriptase domain-containing protein [Tanacetum cinerariifolium]
MRLPRTRMRELRAMSSTTHAMMKFPTLRGITTLVSQTAAIFKCRQLESKQTLPRGQPKKEAAKNGDMKDSCAEKEKGGDKGGCGVDQGENSKASAVSDMDLQPRPDYYPLKEIDLKIEVVMGFPYTCFLVAYKGYHQIQMVQEDEEKSSFLHQSGDVLLYQDAIQLEKRRSNLSKTGGFSLLSAARKEPGGVCGRYSYQKQNKDGHDNGYNENLRQLEEA